MIIIPFAKTPDLKEQSFGIEPPIKPRTDMKTRALVEKAVALQDVVGTSIAAGFLKNKNVPFKVVHRVLRDPEHRRKY
jgi:hypothetical protein